MKINHEIEQRLKVPYSRIVTSIISLLVLLIPVLFKSSMEKELDTLEAYFLGIGVFMFVLFFISSLWISYQEEYEPIIKHKLKYKGDPI